MITTSTATPAPAPVVAPPPSLSVRTDVRAGQLVNARPSTDSSDGIGD